jgi:hypothetical protein
VSGKVTLTTGTVAVDNGNLIITGDLKGTTTLQLKLQKTDGATFTDVANSEYSFSTAVVEKADIVSYELADIDPLHDINGGDTTDVTVYGVLANGSKVVVPNSWLIVTTNNANVVYSAGTLTTDIPNVTGTDVSSVTVKVEVIVDATSAPVFLTKNVVVTEAAPVVTTTVVSTSVVNGAVTFTGANVNAITFAAALQDLYTFTDQYGNVINNDTATITFTSLVDAEFDGSAIVVNTGNATVAADMNFASAGDTFNVIVKAAGYTNTIKVVVTP